MSRKNRNRSAVEQELLDLANGRQHGEQPPARYGTSERLFGTTAYVEMRRIRKMPTRSQHNPEKATIQGPTVRTYRSFHARHAAVNREFATNRAALAERTAERNARIAELMTIANQA